VDPVAARPGAGVPASFLLTEQLSGTVRLSIIHSAKGLDAAHVLLFGAHELEGRDDEEARVLSRSSGRDGPVAAPES